MLAQRKGDMRKFAALTEETQPLIEELRRLDSAS